MEEVYGVGGGGDSIQCVPLSPPDKEMNTHGEIIVITKLAFLHVKTNTCQI